MTGPKQDGAIGHVRLVEISVVGHATRKEIGLDEKKSD
jgi:hypothetical protein